MIPDCLLSQFLTNFAGNNCNFHSFVSVLNQEEISIICIFCLLHVRLEIAQKSNDCRHFYKVNQELLRWNAECFHCHQTVNLQGLPRVTDKDLTNQFLNNKGPSARATALFMLIFYAGNSLNELKPINSENAKFKEFISISPTSLQVMNMLGYTLVDSYFQPSPSANRKDLTLILQELCLLRCIVFNERYILDNGQSQNTSHIYSFLDATLLICDAFGVKYNSSNPQSFLDQVKSTAMKTPRYYTILGCTYNANDQFIIQCYNTMKLIYPNNVALYMDALLDIVRVRKSSLLEEFAVMEQSRGVISQSELNSAYRLFGGLIAEDTPSRTMVEIYKRAVDSNPAKKAEYTDALRLIANHRDDYITKFYLSNSMFPPFMDEMETDVTIDLPAGLNNIGNTCYLNSLLQYYFSLKRFRETAISYTPSPDYLTRIDESKLKLAEKSLTFVKLLKELFLDLIHSDEVAVTPPKMLAQIALNDSTGALFGEQQDIMETQDNILDMLDLLVEMSGKPKKGMFLGTTRQTVKYFDKNGIEKSLLKEETFNQIIVDVNPSLYTSLDNFFASQTVEYEHSIAKRSVSIVTFPAILTVRINRVKFDRETNQAFKSNEYLEFPKVLYLSRYCAKYEDVVEKKRELKRKLVQEVEHLNRLLERLTTKQNRSDVPINLLNDTLRIVENSDVENASRLGNDIKMLMTDLHNKISTTKEKISSLKFEIETMFDEYQDQSYNIYGIFMHEGGANFGHYWHYLWDAEKNRWIKYNDSKVSVVGEDEVFMNTTGKTFNAFSLIYIDSNHMDMTSPFVRTPEYRQMWMNYKQSDNLTEVTDATETEMETDGAE